MLAITGMLGWITACWPPNVRTGKPAASNDSPGADRHDLVVEAVELGRHRVRRPQPQPRIPLQGSTNLVDVDVVGMLVRDEDAVGAVEGRVDLAEHAGVDDERAVAVVEADAGVGELRQLH